MIMDNETSRIEEAARWAGTTAKATKKLRRAVGEPHQWLLKDVFKAFTDDHVFKENPKLNQALMSLFGVIDVDGFGLGDWVNSVSPAAMLESFDSYDDTAPLTGCHQNGNLKQLLFDKNKEKTPQSDKVGGDCRTGRVAVVFRCYKQVDFNIR